MHDEFFKEDDIKAFSDFLDEADGVLADEEDILDDELDEKNDENSDGYTYEDFFGSGVRNSTYSNVEKKLSPIDIKQRELQTLEYLNSRLLLRCLCMVSKISCSIG